MVTPTFEYETRFWKEGVSVIAGIDEVGMGAWAGPVVAGAVVFDSRFFQSTTSPPLTPPQRGGGTPVIRDSKTMSARQREAAEVWIRENAMGWAVGEASVEEISELNIRGAAQLAMRRAVDALRIRPDLLLIDGTEAQPHELIPAVCIVDGDATCISISAASILAKIHRDKIMIELDGQFPGYGLAKNKGYGTKEHLEGLGRSGVTECHRRSFAPVAAMSA